MPAAPKPEGVREILVIKLSALGDILLVTPVLAQLAAAYPRARLTVLCGHDGRDILARCPVAHRVLSVPEGVARFPFLGRSRRMRRILRATAFDLALDLQGLARSWHFLRRARATFRIGKGRFPGLDAACPHRRSQVRHAVDSYFELTALLGLAAPAATAARVLFVPMPADRAAAAPFHAGPAPVVLAPYASRAAKQWPEAGWHALGRRLVGAGTRVVVAGGSGDASRAGQLAAAIGSGTVSTAGHLAIGPFGALLERAAALVAPDSFPMHLAAALGTPLVALFGPTDPARTGPWQGHALVLRRQPLRELAVDTVLDAVQRIRELRPSP